MTMRMSGWRVLVGLSALTLTGCGGGTARETAATPPQTESAKADAILGDPPGWTDVNLKSAEFYRAGNYIEALKVLETFAQAHPSFDQVELMLGDNLLTMPSDDKAVEREYREKAVGHLRRGLELAREDDSRDWGERRLLLLFSQQNLDRPADAEVVARSYSKRHPSEARGYGEVASALRRQQKHDEATRVLRDASGLIEDGGRRDYVESLVIHAQESPSMAPADQRQLLADASPVVQSLLTANPRDVQGLSIKARMVAVEARLEPNPAKKKALEAESKRLDAASGAALLEELRRRQ